MKYKTALCQIKTFFFNNRKEKNNLFLKSKDLFSFLVMRHPFDRVLSAYRWICVVIFINEVKLFISEIDFLSIQILVQNVYHMNISKWQNSKEIMESIFWKNIEYINQMIQSMRKHQHLKNLFTILSILLLIFMIDIGSPLFKNVIFVYLNMTS